MEKGNLSEKNVLTVREAAVLYSLSTSYLYKQTADRNLPFYKPTGKLVYFNRLELEAWLQRNRIAPNEEIRQEARENIQKSAKR